MSSNEMGPPADYDKAAAANAVRRLLVTGLMANVLYFVGSAMFVAEAALELRLQCEARQDTATNVVYSLAFAAFFLSALMELLVDVYLVRTIAHGRYTTKQPWNLIITTLFSVGTLMDLLAFAFWHRFQQTKEENTLLAGASLWLLTSLIVLGTKCHLERSSESTQEYCLDAVVGNLFFFLGSVLVFAARFVGESSESWCFNRTERQLELAAASTWVASAVFYIVSDVIRLKEEMGNRTTQ